MVGSSLQYLLDDFVITPAAREVRRGDDRVPVEPRVFDLLLLMISRSGDVVSKDDMVAEIWGGRAVSDDTLSSAIRDLRRALGDNGKTQKIVRTVHGRGFQLACPVDRIDRGAALTNPGPTPEIEPAIGTAGRRASVAVLNFHVEGRDTDPGLGAALCRDVTIALARTRWLFVTAQASAARFELGETAPRDIAIALSVHYIVSGAVRTHAGRIRLSVMLIDATSGETVWADVIERGLADLFSTLTEVTNSVAVNIEAEIERQERRRAELVPIANLDAWTAYHRATSLLFRYTSQSLSAAEVLLERAARLDPSSSRISAARSFLHWQKALLDSTEDIDGEIGRAVSLAERSVTLDPRDPQGHWALGRASILLGDQEGATRELDLAVDLNPNFAMAHYSRSWAMNFGGEKSAAGLDAVRQARNLSPFDPLSFGFIIHEADLSLFAGDEARAMKLADVAVRHPHAHQHVYAIAAFIHELSGNHARGRELAGAVLKRRPEYGLDAFLRAIPATGFRRDEIARAFANIGL